VLIKTEQCSLNHSKQGKGPGNMSRGEMSGCPPSNVVSDYDEPAVLRRQMRHEHDYSQWRDNCRFECGVLCKMCRHVVELAAWCPSQLRLYRWVQLLRLAGAR